MIFGVENRTRRRRLGRSKWVAVLAPALIVGIAPATRPGPSFASINAALILCEHSFSISADAAVYAMQGLEEASDSDPVDAVGEAYTSILAALFWLERIPRSGR